MFIRLVNEMADKQGVTEQLKASDQMVWVSKINNICSSVTEIINADLIYANPSEIFG